jgi:protein tyrosine/serine phosphatase/predicted nucleotidyltransferase
MKQLEILNQIQPLIESVPGIQGALLIGSFARRSPKWNSDLDLSFWVANDFDPEYFIARAKSRFSDIFQFGLHTAYRKHLTLYFSDRPKVDIGLFESMEGLNRNFLGSEIKDIGASVLFDPNQVLIQHLTRISENHPPGGISDYAGDLNCLIDKFLFDFEQFSEAHRRSDAYKSYFFYNIALNAAIQIRYLARGKRSFYFLPKNFATTVLTRDEGYAFRDLQGTLYLPEINALKRRLIDFFLQSLEESQVIDTSRFQELSDFCEYVYSRDFIWNFRDIADINPNIRPGQLYRASSLTRYQEEPFFPAFLEQKGIRKILDLRDHDELAANPYSPVSLSLFSHIHIPIDPKVQSESFRAENLYGTHEEIAYRYFGLECKAQIKQMFEALGVSGDGGALIHCHAGKDRTGVLVTLIHLLSGASEQTIQMDYLASEMDTNPNLLGEFRKIVDRAGGIEPYLLSCGISRQTLDIFCSKALKGGEV